jgi:hypothetical protein
VIFLSRKKKGPDPYLEWKVRLFSGGAVLALVGLGLESSLLVGLAILILLVGVGLRFLPGGEWEEGGSPDEERADMESAEPGDAEEDTGS